MVNYLLLTFSYFGIVLAVAFSGYLIPLPEDIILPMIGYAAGSGVFNLYFAMAAAVAGTIFADNILYWLSRSGSHYISRMLRLLSAKKLEEYQKKMHEHAGKTIFVLRFLPGVRIFMPIAAGTIKIPWAKFQFFQVLAVLIFVPAMVFFGYIFHESITVLIFRIEEARHIIFIIFAVAAGIVIAHIIRKYFFTKKNT